MAPLPSAYVQLFFYLTVLAFMKVNCISFDFLSHPSLLLEQVLSRLLVPLLFPLNDCSLFDACRNICLQSYIYPMKLSRAGI